MKYRATSYSMGAVVGQVTVEAPNHTAVSRAERHSVLLPIEGASTQDEYAVARHRLEMLTEDVRVDLLAQFEVGEENARRQADA